MQFPISPVERGSAPTDIPTCPEEEARRNESIDIHDLESIGFSGS